MMMLDLESVRLFVLAVDLGGLTRAAEAAGTVQPAVSQRLKALEMQLGRKLLERSPRFVRPTADGAVFLDHARALLAAHDKATGFAERSALRFAIGISDHALGLALEGVIRRLRASLPAHAALEVRVALSQPLRTAFDEGVFDAVVIRREAGGSGGEVLGQDALGWRGDAAADHGIPLPLATLGAPCGVRAAAIRALDHAGLAWRESFVAGSVAALVAGVRAGIGIAPMGAAGASGLPDLGPVLGLPPLPASEIALFARASSPEVAALLRALAAGVRAAL